jgi:secondary thiamine-phosphate synthase enzyme
MVFRDVFTIQTSGHRDMHEITGEVQAMAARSGIREGIVHVFNIGSTGIIGTVEYEPGLAQDLPEILDRLIPPSRDYGHELAWHDGNGHSHLQATMLGPEITVPLAEGCLTLGTWQQIFHLEADIKPRLRKIIVTVIGDRE